MVPDTRKNINSFYHFFRVPGTIFEFAKDVETTQKEKTKAENECADSSYTKKLY